MAQYMYNTKHCATCAFWLGNRDCDSWGQRVTVRNSTERGKCAAPKGGWKGQQKLADFQCNGWQKWAVLK